MFRVSTLQPSNERVSACKVHLLRGERVSMRKVSPLQPINKRVSVFKVSTLCTAKQRTLQPSKGM